ncbi:alanine racemase [Marinospirillum insulare]|uniref:Alanine racemase n=1 Tax=Marinospirillum insulare TaxID=217169 RepID=A0ABQ6A125_9GAMM|nr:alanine racemase [Marinospirillum insulare]GLR64977.1 alanine racemase [Marinospirillum insulare]
MARPLVAEINLAALRHNYQLALSQSATSSALAVVKANAYGHGAVKVAKTLADLAPAFAVASIEEANELVTAGITQPITLLEGFFDASELPTIFANSYQPLIHNHWQVTELIHYLAEHPQAKASLSLWLKVDTGMHRLGFSPEQTADIYTQLKDLAAIKEITLTSHFACADDLTSQATNQQLKLLTDLQKQLACPISIANSPATLGWPASQTGYLRPGIMLYGASPFAPGHLLGDQLQTVMTLKSQLISVRDLPAGEPVGYGARFVTQKPTRIGVVACGYGDGYPRQAIDGTPALVKGIKCQLAGRVSMDMLTLDLTNCPNAQVGDEVILWGENLSVNEVASYCDTISYTLLTCLLPRVKRQYINDVSEE